MKVKWQGLGVGAKRGSEMSLRVLLCAKISGHGRFAGELVGEVSEWGPSFSQDGGQVCGHKNNP